MVDNGLKVLPSNSAVVQALAQGDIIVGLTDTDDVWAGQAQQWPVDLVYEAPDRPREKFVGLPSPGPLLIPNTVGRMVGSPNAIAGDKLADFLLSEKVEKILAESTSRNIPIRPDLAKKYPAIAVANEAPVDWTQVARHEVQALQIADAVLPK
jgi:ABC-type Fe3+ transport system substrate-binding protein